MNYWEYIHSLFKSTINWPSVLLSYLQPYPPLNKLSRGNAYLGTYSQVWFLISASCDAYFITVRVLIKFIPISLFCGIKFPFMVGRNWFSYRIFLANAELAECRVTFICETSKPKYFFTIFPQKKRLVFIIIIKLLALASLLMIF